MKRKSFLLIFFSCVLVLSIVSVCVLVVPQLSLRATSESYTQSQSDNGTASDSQLSDGSTNEIEASQSVTYYINEQSVTKTLETSGETKILKLTFSLFIKNDTSKSEQFLSKGFSSKYLIGTSGTLLECNCLSESDYIEVGSGVASEVNFELKYVITDQEFNYNESYELVVNYLSEQVYSVEM